MGLRVLLAVLATSLLPLADAPGETRPGLDSFYVTQSNRRIVHATPTDGGVNVRIIEVDYLDPQCRQRVVRSYETVVPGVRVQDVASVGLCALSADRVARASEAAREPSPWVRYSIPSGRAITNVVATCGGQERRFVSDEDSRFINRDELRRIDADVFRVVTLGDTVGARASQPDAPTQEALGVAAARDLIAGRYDAAYVDACWNRRGQRVSCQPSAWKEMLGEYTGPPEHRGLLPAELLERDALQFDHFVAPDLPMIARSARVLGDVRVRLEVDRATGAVPRAAIVRGFPLLNNAALTAVRQWRFKPWSTQPDPIEVTLRFSEKCPNR